MKHIISFFLAGCLSPSVIAEDLNLEPLTPLRGLIYDRNNKPLVENKIQVDVEITPTRLDCPESETRKTCVLRLLMRLRKLIKIEESDQVLLQRLATRQSTSELLSLAIRRDLTEQELARITPDLSQLSGVALVPRVTRKYLYANSLAHVIGYAGYRNDLAKQNGDKTRQADPSDTTYLGLAGIEAQYDLLLQGTTGIQRVEKNSAGRITKATTLKPAAPGKNLFLTIDIRLQVLAEKLLGKNSGSVVALDPNNGEILALVSMPGFNNNSVGDMNNSKRAPFARALQGTYPPGSTIKPFYALGGLHYDIIKPNTTISCQGFFTLPSSDHRWRDWQANGHGRVNLKTSIMRSCDVYYYGLSVKMHIDKITAILSRFGFGEKTEIDLPSEANGVLPSREWKRKKFGQLDKKQMAAGTWYTGDTVSVGIGQGYFTVTPMQLAYATSILANRGKGFKPHLLYATQDSTKGEQQIISPVLKTDITDIKPEYWKAISDGMVGVVHQKIGTASNVAKFTQGKFKLAGKTGTAQLFKVGQTEEYEEEDVPRHLRDHALFTSFAPAENPKIVVTVLVDHGGHGSTGAAPIAAKLVKAYFDMLNADRGIPSTPMKEVKPKVKPTTRASSQVKPKAKSERPTESAVKSKTKYEHTDESSETESDTP